MNRTPIFDAAKALGARFPNAAAVARMDAAIDEALGGPPAIEPLSMSARGKALVKSFESCRLVAYPDPGSANGKPWTIGWGATGPGIGPGVVWTQAQADARFDCDCQAIEAGVNRLLGGAPTSQNQFDALCSLAFNIGLDENHDGKAQGLGDSSLLKAHKAGEYGIAAGKFIAWRFNDGKEMAGLVRRRKAEAALYREP